MAKVTMRHGASFDVLTVAEAEQLIEAARGRNVKSRVRGTAIIALDGNGNGQDEVYAIPMGFEFEVRRVFVDFAEATSPGIGNFLLNGVGALEYLRSGTRIEYAIPLSPQGAVAQIPGVQTWGAEQGPYLRNGEVFEVKARSLAANNHLSVSMEGILARRAADR